MNDENTAPPAAVREEAQRLQRQWLEQARVTGAKNPLEFARRIGEKLHDAHIRQFEAELKKIKSEADTKDAGEELRLDETHNPLWQALRGFLQTSGPARESMEELAREYLGYETEYRQKTATAQGATAEKLTAIANSEREKADKILAADRLSLSTPTSQEEKRGMEKRGIEAKKSTPIPINTLERTINDFLEQAAEEARRKAKSRNKTQPEATVAIRMNPETVLATWRKRNADKELPDAYRALFLGPEGDAAILSLREQALQREKRERQQRKAVQFNHEAETALKNIRAWALKFQENPEQVLSNDRLYEGKELDRAWTRAGNQTPRPPEWLLIQEGPEGDTARADQATREIRRREEEEEHLEQEILKLDETGRVERRSEPNYSGQPLYWPLSRLHAIWKNQNPDAPMPRRWLRQAAELKETEANRLIACEQQAAAAHQQAVTAHEQAAELKRKKATLLRKAEEERQAWKALLEAQEAAGAAISQAGLEPAIPEPHAHRAQLWQTQQEHDQEYLSLNTPTPGRIQAPSPRRTAGTPPRHRRKPQPAPARHLL